MPYISRSRRVRARALSSAVASIKFLENLEPRQMLAAHIVGNPTVFSTIQAAVDAAGTGATILVDPGNYTEQVIVGKSLTLRGAQAGVDARSNARASGANESVWQGVADANGKITYAVKLAANDITLDGFTIQGETSPSTTVGAGVVIAPNISGSQVLNNIIQNNVSGLYVANSSNTKATLIQHNVFRNNNVDGPNSGRGIYSDGGVSGGILTNVTIDGNFFFKNFGGVSTTQLEPAVSFEAATLGKQSNIRITNNVFNTNGKSLLAFNIDNLTITGNVSADCDDTTSGGLRFEGGCSNVTIRNNNVYSSGARGIRIDQKAFANDNFNFTIENNNIYQNGLDTGGENTGLLTNTLQYQGSFSAINNYWGASSGPSGDGPGTGDAIRREGNNVTFSPWASTYVVDPQAPFYGASSDATSAIQAEDYDHGTEGVSYHDTSSANSGGRYRPYQGVDIESTTDTGAGYDVTGKATEWIEYGINVPSGGTYTGQFRVANSSTGGVFHVEIDGVDVSGAISVPNTGGIQSWQTISQTGINLAGGTHLLRLVFDTNAGNGQVANLNWFKFALSGSNAPTAPSALVASAASATQVNLSWTDNSSDETGFILERMTGSTNVWQSITTTAANVTTFSDNTVAASTTYTYRVRATNGSGDSANALSNAVTTPAGTSTTTYLSDLAFATTPTNGWGPVEKDLSNGSQGAGDGTTITLNGVTYAKGLGCHAISDIAYNLGGQYSSFTSDVGVDDEVASGSSIIFQVFADGVKVYDSGVMGPSTATKTINLSMTGVQQLRLHVDDGGDGIDYDHADWAGARLTAGSTPQVPAAPSALAATPASTSQINLAWTDNSTNETGFRIERSPDGSTGWTEIGTTGANVTTFNNTGLSAATKYYYRVRATNAAGDSAYSNTANATTLANTSTNATYIATGAIWKYLDNGSNQGTAWRATSFADSAWKNGPAQLGYGDGDEATVVSFGPDANNKFITTYFRDSFSVADPSLVTSLTMRILRDDGAVVYLNGTEVFRTNMPTGTIAYNTLASTSIEDPPGTFYSSSIAPSLLVAGTNVIAVEVHQADVTSSDISFDFDLKATLSQPSTPPAAPSALGATAAGSNQINLAWTDNSTNETGFRIERSPDGTTGWASAGTVAANVTTFQDTTSLQPATQYFYRVFATNSAGDSTASNTASATTAAITKPAAPSNLVATAFSSSQINLTWTDNSNNESGFILERSPDGSTGWTQIATPAINATSYNDTSNLSPSTQYFYRIRASNTSGDSTNSNTASATTQAPPTAPLAPTSLGANAVSSSQINLAWTDNSSNETGFKIERSSDNVTFTQVGTTAVNVASFSDTTGLLPGTQYYYRIRATNAVGDSGYSNTASATTNPGLFAPWVDANIGSPSPTGTGSYANGTFTVTGGGADIGGTADSFNYVYQPWTGDGQILLQVGSIQNTNAAAKAGIMFRATLNAGAKQASLVVTPTSGIQFIRRTNNNNAATTTTVAALSAPYWLKLIRSGQNFTAYRSADGTTWTQVDTAKIAMPSTVYVGMAVTSKSPGTLCTATFTNVTISASTSSTLGPSSPAAAPAITSTVAGTNTLADATTQQKDLLDLLS